jgi:hypothetical protein
MPKDSLFPADEPRGFQVWHKQGERYEHVATVESNALGAIMMTTRGFMGYARWQDNPAVTAMPGEHRSTTIGDVLIGRDGQSLEIAADGGLHLKPIAPIDQSPSDAKGTRPGPEAPPPDMPTREQMEAVVREIDLWLAGLAVLPIQDKHGLPAAEGRRFLFWDEMTEDYRRHALASEIDWKGFTEGQKDNVIRRVLDGQVAESWMDGITAPKSSAPDSAHRAQFQQRDDAKDLDR